MIHIACVLYEQEDICASVYRHLWHLCLTHVCSLSRRSLLMGRDHLMMESVDSATMQNFFGAIDCI